MCYYALICKYRATFDPVKESTDAISAVAHLMCNPDMSDFNDPSRTAVSPKSWIPGDDYLRK